VEGSGRSLCTFGLQPNAEGKDTGLKGANSVYSSCGPVAHRYKSVSSRLQSIPNLKGPEFVMSCLSFRIVGLRKHLADLDNV
jgi:hypothetical protein